MSAASFIASLRSNPLFLREWRRVIGRPHGFILRVAVIVTAAFVFGTYIAPLLARLKPNPPYSPTQSRMMMLRFAATFIFLDPFNWLVAYMSWHSIDIEHRRGRAQPLAASLLSDWDIFWAKMLPTSVLVNSCLVVCTLLVSIISLYQERQYTGIVPTPDIYFYTNVSVCVIMVPLRYLMNLLACFFLIERWPSLRRNGVVIFLTLTVCGLCAWLINSLLNLVFLPNSFGPGFLDIDLWILVLFPLLKSIVFAVLAGVLVMKVGPHARLLFLDESRLSIKPFNTARIRVRLRRFVRRLQSWHGE